MLRKKLARYLRANKKKGWKRTLPALAGISFVVLTIPLLAILLFSLFYWGKVFPGISVASVEIGGLPPEVVIEKLSREITPPKTITLSYQNESFEIPTDSLSLSYNFSKTASLAYNTHRTGNLLFDYYSRLASPFTKHQVGLYFELNEKALSDHLSVIAGQVYIEAVNPSVEIMSDEVIIITGTKGQEADQKLLRALIGEHLSNPTGASILVPLTIIDPTITKNQAEKLKIRSEKFLDKSLMAKYNDHFFEYDPEHLLKLLDVKNKYNQSALQLLVDDVANAINRDPQNSVFVFENNKVKNFTPALDGLTVDKEKLGHLALKALDFLESSEESETLIEIPVTITPPEINTEDVNSLGIKELIGKGESRFKGSISSRIHNIGVASEQFNGILVKPGEIMSFNDFLGDVSSYTGYKQAYIIKDGKTILGDGGGVCQVSTTLFRAALDTGLPIAERRAHSYRVAYYEQGFPPGLDATVYSPTTDLKIVNDTPGHILIQTKFNAKSATLAFEVYGTSDGRVSQISKPTVTGVTPPPEDLYTDDPTKPVGYIEQIDWAAWGAKVNFNYTVERNGETIYEKTFYSNFRPWQAKFLRGTAPVN